MAVIIAEGKTVLGKLRVVIKGDEQVKDIQCEDEAITEEIRKGIEDADGWIANAYHPEANTMLQAYAFLLELFEEKDIQVTGDIGEIPQDEKGVIY